MHVLMKIFLVVILIILIAALVGWIGLFFAIREFFEDWWM